MRPVVRRPYLNGPRCRDSGRRARRPPGAVSPRRTGPDPGPRLLAALLNVRPDELLGVLLEYLVDLVEDRVHVIGELLLTLLDVLVRLWRGLLGLLAALGSLPLTTGVLCRHSETSVLQGHPRSFNRILACQLLVQPWIGTSHLIRDLDQPWPLSAATSSVAVRQRSSRPPTCARVPRSGSRVGTRCRDSWPGTSKITESHAAAATASGYCRRHRPRK